MNYSDDEAPLLSRQEQIAAQDRGLDDLASIIRRQRELGIMIGNEVEEQNGSFCSNFPTLFIASRDY